VNAPAICRYHCAVPQSFVKNLKAIEWAGPAQVTEFAGFWPFDESRKSSDLAAENAGEHFRLALVGAIVDEEAGATLGLSCPEIAFPSSYPDEAQTVEREDLGGGRLSLQLSKPKSEPWTLRQSILSAEGASFGQGEARSLRRSAKDALPTKEEQELLSAQKLLDPPWR